MSTAEVERESGEPTHLALIVDAIAAEYHSINSDTVEWVVGRAQFGSFGETRRISFVPVPGDFEVPGQHLPARGEDPDGSVYSLAVVLNETCDVYVTAEDPGETERLFFALVSAMFTCPTLQIDRDQLRAHEWVTERDKEAGIMTRTPMKRLRVFFPLPIRRATEPVTVVTAQEHTCRYVTEL